MSRPDYRGRLVRRLGQQSGEVDESFATAVAVEAKGWDATGSYCRDSGLGLQEKGNGGKEAGGSGIRGADASQVQRMRGGEVGACGAGLRGGCAQMQGCLGKKGNQMMRLTETRPRAESEGQRLKRVLRELRSCSLSGLISHQ